MAVAFEVGTRLAGRYRLETCLERQNGASTWRALDEKLSRPVGVHMVPADHDLAEDVVTAARHAAAVDDGRFLRVLDAVRRDGLVYVVYEWVPDARPLRSLLANGPLDPQDAHLLALEAAEAIAAAHRLGLAHLRLDPDTLLRTDGGQVKILGLCVEAALHGTTSTDPEATDARGLGRVLYAALTGKWPDGQAYGLPAAPHEHGALCTPRQVRAGVPPQVDDVVDRVLNPAPRHGPPLRSPAAVSAALHELPRPRPASPEFPTGPLPAVATTVTGLPAVGRATEQTRPGVVIGPSPRATRTVRLVVGAVLAVGLVLLGWQIYQATPKAGGASAAGSTGASNTPVSTLKIVSANDFDPPPGNGEEHGSQAPNAIDGDPGTVWTTQQYNSAELGGLKPGVGLVLDLGATQTVREVRLQLVGDSTDLQIRATDPAISSAPLDLGAYKVAAEKTGARSVEAISLPNPVRTRYVLLWLTRLPSDGTGRYRGGVAEVEVRG